MLMRARQQIPPGEDITPPLPPLSHALYTSSLHTHCSSCFSPLPPSHHPYCSPPCSRSDSHIHLASAEVHLLENSDGEDTSDLRAALRLLCLFEDGGVCIDSARVGGLMSNYHKLVVDAVRISSENGEEDEVLARIKYGAREMAKARRMRDGLDVGIVGECKAEEIMLCVVLTNAVEVQINGGPGVGIAVYDMAFSWINHSCSPNACYRFSLWQNPSGGSQMLIVPASHNGAKETKYREFELMREGESHGPRIVVRSIRDIDEGGEVFVAYSDLLQHKAMRQSELWSKYRFICSCQRCNASPPTYVDQTLQEIFPVKCNGCSISSDYEDEANERFSVLVDDAISEYLMYSNSKSCCEKLESLLIKGIPDEDLELKEAKSKRQYFLHPLHHLALNAYTTLSSAYKTRASELVNLNFQDKSFQFEALDMHRTSAAYSLLLACAAHHLFLSESSIVICVANFWTQAGDSLLNVAKNTEHEPFSNLVPTTETRSFFHKCHNFASVPRPARKTALEEMSKEFLEYVSGMVPKLWPFLSRKSCYLELINDPCFGRIGNTDSKILLCSTANLNRTFRENSGTLGGAFVCRKQENIGIFQLGVHCLLYGDFLLSTFCGQPPHSNVHVENLLYYSILKN